VCLLCVVGVYVFGIGATPFLTFLASRHNVYPFTSFELLPCVLGIVVAAGTDLAQGATVLVDVHVDGAWLWVIHVATLSNLVYLIGVSPP